MPPVRTKKKHKSIEQIRILKEQQKIREFFSKRDDDSDGGFRESGTSLKLPNVKKNLLR